MPARKKKKNPVKPRSARKQTPAKKLARKRTASRKPSKKKIAKKKLANRKVAKKKPAKPASTRLGAPPSTPAFTTEKRRSRSGEQSGDLQGLSNISAADSESVDELLEEGNAFEAEVVTGVEAAGDRREKEVRTHEVPQDDVPTEYQDD